MPKSVALNLNEEQLPTSKKCFVNDIRHFREQALGMFSVKKCYLFEGVSPSFSILAELLKCAQNAHKVSKIGAYYKFITIGECIFYLFRYAKNILKRSIIAIKY